MKQAELDLSQNGAPAPERTGREALEARWLELTRERLPEVASARGWPVRFDHCFQRILLDNACGTVWYERIAKRPAYAHASDSVLGKAVSLGEAVLDGTADLDELNRRSLEWRGKQGPRSLRTGAARA